MKERNIRREGRHKGKRNTKGKKTQKKEKQEGKVNMKERET